MASFSDTHPFAYHVFPLTAARGIWRRGALLGKQDLAGIGQMRRTTRDVDIALGFAEFVHFYLPKGHAKWTTLPILQAQLGPAKKPPVPHALLIIPTSSWDDVDCTICNWNIAVSRPKVEGMCRGGNWTRGTRPSRIVEVWDAFRRLEPALERARGFWCGPRVPVIPGDRIGTNLPLLRKHRIPELLLRSPVRLPSGAMIHVFSEADEKSLATLGPAPAGVLRVPWLRPNRRSARPGAGAARCVLGRSA